MCSFLQANRNQLCFAAVWFFFLFSLLPKCSLLKRAWSERGDNGSLCGVQVLGTPSWLTGTARKVPRKEQSSLLGVAQKEIIRKVWYGLMLLI